MRFLFLKITQKLRRQCALPKRSASSCFKTFGDDCCPPHVLQVEIRHAMQSPLYTRCSIFIAEGHGPRTAIPHVHLPTEQCSFMYARYLQRWPKPLKRHRSGDANSHEQSRTAQRMPARKLATVRLSAASKSWRICRPVLLAPDLKSDQRSSARSHCEVEIGNPVATPVATTYIPRVGLGMRPMPRWADPEIAIPGVERENSPRC